jgi:hypothetical protein
MLPSSASADKPSASACTSGQGAAWQVAAPSLALWTWQRLVNRTDVWGGYNAICDRDKIVNGKPLGKTTTRPAVAKRGKALLDLAIIRQHFRATRPEQVTGLHTTSPSNTSRWGAVEVDWHGETSVPAVVNLGAALAWFDLLRGIGFHPLLTDSNGQGGYHLLTIFSKDVATPTVFAFLKWLTRNHTQLGLPVPPETFPKQPRIDPGKYGNWLRLPGRHHTQEHWSRVWDGAGWLEGAAAIDFMLGIRGDDPRLISAEAAAFCSRPARPPGQATIHTTYLDNGRLAARVRKYLDRLPTGLGEGQHRDDYAFNFACFMARDLALCDDVCLAWLGEFDRRQAAQKGDVRLREILESAKKYGQRPVGCGLRPEPTMHKGRHGHTVFISRVEIG